MTSASLYLSPKSYPSSVRIIISAPRPWPFGGLVYLMATYSAWIGFTYSQRCASKSSASCSPPSPFRRASIPSLALRKTCPAFPGDVAQGLSRLHMFAPIGKDLPPGRNRADRYSSLLIRSIAWAWSKAIRSMIRYPFSALSIAGCNNSSRPLV